MNETCKLFVASAIAPCNGGRIAPPRIAITNSDDTWLFKTPVPSSASENVFDQPMEVNKPTATTHHIATLPPTRIAVSNSATTVSEKIISVCPARAWPNWNSSQHRPMNGRYSLNTDQLSWN